MFIDKYEIWFNYEGLILIVKIKVDCDGEERGEKRRERDCENL